MKNEPTPTDDHCRLNFTRGVAGVVGINDQNWRELWKRQPCRFFFLIRRVFGF
jgi:hypothetical protein